MSHIFVEHGPFIGKLSFFKKLHAWTGFGGSFYSFCFLIKNEHVRIDRLDNTTIKRIRTLGRQNMLVKCLSQISQYSVFFYLFKLT